MTPKRKKENLRSIRYSLGKKGQRKEIERKRGNNFEKFRKILI